VDDEGTPAKNIFDWYRRSIPLTFSRLRGAIIVTVIVFVAAFIVGVVIGNMEQWRLNLPPQDDFVQQAEQLGSYLNPALQREAMGFIIWQNARVLLAAFILAMFTFGVGALVIAPATFAILGYLFSQMVIAGYNPLFMVSAVLTHGIVEIPVIIIAIAASVRLGAVMTRPPRGNTVGHAWTVALGDVVKLALGVVIPGLIIAGFLESFVTPEVVLTVLGR
jgi:stage II sporulation protein M